MKLGRFELYILEDGTFRLDGGAMFGVVPKVLWQKTDPADEKNRILMGVNCLLVRTSDRNILIDTGTGSKYSSRLGDIYQISKPRKLLSELNKRGLKPEDIDTVILSHLHFDHCGGNTYYNPNGNPVPTFPAAKYVVQKREWEEALDPNPREKASYLPENLYPIEEWGLLELIEGDQTIAEGIQILVTGGHTRAHQIVRVTSEGETALFLADLIPTSSHLKIPYVMGYDLYPLETMAYKEKILVQAKENHWLLIFEHSPRLEAGYLRESGGEITLEKADV